MHYKELERLQRASTSRARADAGEASGAARRDRTRERDKRIYLLKFAGSSSYAIAEKFGITRQAVDYIFRRHTKEEIQ